MKDVGLHKAVDVAGGIVALSRALGISQPSVSKWSRVPAERVLAVESLTGVPRSVLRPDLYPKDSIVVEGDSERAIDEIDQARAQQYLLLARLLRRAPDAAMLARLARLRGDATEFGMALIALAQAAGSKREDAVGGEFFQLFVGVGRGELLPYASFYLTGFLHERPLARVRADLQRLGIERAPGDYEPEDHIATLFEVMGGLAGGTFEGGDAEQKAFFERHLKPWAARFFLDLEMSKTAVFYKAVAQLGRLYVDIEAEGFAIGA